MHVTEIYYFFAFNTGAPGASRVPVVGPDGEFIDFSDNMHEVYSFESKTDYSGFKPKKKK